MQITVPNASNKMLFRLGEPLTTRNTGRKMEGFETSVSVFDLNADWSPATSESRQFRGWVTIACHKDGKNFICTQEGDGPWRLSEIMTDWK